MFGTMLLIYETWSIESRFILNSIYFTATCAYFNLITNGLSALLPIIKYLDLSTIFKPNTNPTKQVIISLVHLVFA